MPSKIQNELFRGVLTMAVLRGSLKNTFGGVQVQMRCL